MAHHGKGAGEDDWIGVFIILAALFLYVLLPLLIIKGLWELGFWLTEPREADEISWTAYHTKHNEWRRKRAWLRL